MKKGDTALVRLRGNEAHLETHFCNNCPTFVGSTGRVAVKVINHLGDEVMKVSRV